MPNINRSLGRKISNFPASASLPATAMLDFISAGVNYKISLADFIASLGVTGSIVQAGDPTSTPVLDTQGPVNNIRNIKNGAGISASVNASNGITLAHNFAQDSSGIPLLNDISALQPTFASLVEGDGIDIAVDGNTLTISSTGEAAATKVVHVNSASDFPAAIGGVITLAADTAYSLANNITVASRFVFSNNSAIVGVSNTLCELTYSGAGVMFSGADVNAQFFNCRVSCPSGTLFNFTASTPSTYRLAVDFMGVTACASIGTVSGFGVIALGRFAVLSATNGLTISGANIAALIVEDTTINTTNASATLIDIGSATFDLIDVAGCIFRGVSGTKGIEGVASSGNLTTAGRGILINNDFEGLTALSNISHTDLQWRMTSNAGVEDTREDSLSTLDAAETVTILGVDTPAKIAGTWTDQGSSAHTVDGTGRTTYNSLDGQRAPVSCSVTAHPVSGSNKDFTVYLARNGSVIADSGRTGRASSSDKVSVTVLWQLEEVTDDYFEIWIENNTDAVDLVIDSAVLRVN